MRANERAGAGPGRVVSCTCTQMNLCFFFGKVSNGIFDSTFSERLTKTNWKCKSRMENVDLGWKFSC